MSRDRRRGLGSRGSPPPAPSPPAVDPAADENALDQRTLAAMSYRPTDQRRLTPVVDGACALRTALAQALGMPAGARGHMDRPPPAWTVTAEFGNAKICVRLTPAAALALVKLLPSS